MDPEQQEQSVQTPTDPEGGGENPEKEPSYTHQGNGFVARLPRALRNQIGVMILDGVPHAEILATLGEPVKHLDPAHITGWKKYGYLVWLEDFKRNEALHETHESAAVLLAQKAGVPVQDAGRTLAAAQLYELLSGFNPRTFATAVEEKPELYLRIISTLARLSEGEAACSHYRALDSALETKREQVSPGSQNKNVISQEALTQVVHETKLV